MIGWCLSWIESASWFDIQLCVSPYSTPSPRRPKHLFLTSLSIRYTPDCHHQSSPAHLNPPSHSFAAFRTHQKVHSLPAMRLSTSLIFASLLSFISAEVTFTTPAAGGSVPGGGSISVQWTYAGTPAISTFTTYQLFLMAGGNDGASMVGEEII